MLLILVLKANTLQQMVVTGTDDAKTDAKLIPSPDESSV